MVIGIIGGLIAAFIIIGGISLLISFAMFPQTALMFKSKKEQWLIAERTKELARKYNIPKPPIKYCPDCGKQLSHKYIYNKKLDSDTNTGKEVYSIIITYSCPDKHPTGALDNGLLWQTDWSDLYHWDYVA